MFHLIAETHNLRKDVEEPQGEDMTTSPGHGREIVLSLVNAGGELWCLLLAQKGLKDIC